LPVVLAVPLLVIAAAFVAYAMAALQHSSSAGLVNWLSRVVGNIPIVGGVVSIKQILKLDQWMTHYIGKHFEQVEQKAVGWLVGLATVSRRQAQAALTLAAPVWGLAYWLVHTEIGRQARARDKPIAKQAAHADALARTAVADVADLARGRRVTIKQSQITKIEHVVMPHAAEWEWINSHWQGLKKAIALAAAGALAPTLPRVKPLAWPRGLTPTAIRRRLGRVEALLGVTAFAAVMAKVLGVTPRCLKPGGNVSKFARKLCGLDKWLVDLLLLGSVEAFVALDLCEFAYLLGEAAKLQRPALLELVNVEDALIGCHGSVKPPAYDLPAAALPPLQGVSPLAA